ncbi:MAG TPA: hypothetical protein PKA28_19510 [Methylomusa anaerophila]|uniref:Uncharacterized protein n=1 Tax=Methylomusa anaerophila TaxID=1930071 RepID=A0A348AID4_9FIRM|nr:hypothetical protein [Methylomusa anaerophila]BBB90832.1 hypothetical protein MAMMFC1_01494 [Methylomusa anaerophila]HML90624.1 hypothetical protein [Methylomusa anaerophila]
MKNEIVKLIVSAARIEKNTLKLASYFHNVTDNITVTGIQDVYIEVHDANGEFVAATHFADDRLSHLEIRPKMHVDWLFKMDGSNLNVDLRQFTWRTRLSYSYRELEATHYKARTTTESVFTTNKSFVEQNYPNVTVFLQEDYLIKFWLDRDWEVDELANFLEAINSIYMTFYIVDELEVRYNEINEMPHWMKFRLVSDLVSDRWFIPKEDRLLLKWVKMSSPGDIGFEGLAKISQEVREWVKDLSYRNDQDERMRELLIVEKRLEIIGKAAKLGLGGGDILNLLDQKIDVKEDVVRKLITEGKIGLIIDKKL